MGCGRINAIWCYGVAVVRKKGFCGGLQALFKKGFRVSRTLLYERERGDGEGQCLEKDPASAHAVRKENLAFDVITLADCRRYENDIIVAGGELDVHLFHGGAVCYLARLQGVPVGLGWRFTKSRMLKLLRVMDSAEYVGGFHVREEYRGRGIYPALLERICLDVPHTKKILAETGMENLASQRGLEKAGFKCDVVLIIAVCFGACVYRRLIRRGNQQKK